MKKLIGSVALVAMLAGAAFAEIGMGSWGRAIVAPIASDGHDNVAWEGTSWSGAEGLSRTTGISFFASSENCGFNVDMCGENITQNDTAFFWAKPADFVEVRMGRIQEGTGRGNACWGLWDWKRGEVGGLIGEDFTYMRTTVQGFSVKLTPVDNLWMVAAVDVKDSQEWWKSYVADNTRYGVGYDIPDVGSVRVQIMTRYIESGKSWSEDFKKTDVNYCVINPAFDLTAVENLFVTVGAYIPTANAYNYTAATAASTKYELDTTSAIPAVKPVDVPATQASLSTRDPLQINAAANYKLDALTLHFAIGTKLGLTTGTNKDGDKVLADKFGMVLGFGADYDLGNSLSLVADFKYANQYYTMNKNNDDSFNALVGLNKGLSNGSMGVGFEVGGNCGVLGDASKSKAAHGQFTWAVPVVITLGF